MSNDVRIPEDLYEGDEDSVITAWLASDGARVKQGALIAEIMTAKVQHEMIAPASGILKILKQQDEVVTKGTVIGQIS
ncbi:MAG: biotin attachment protein [Rhodobacteraceae bacterium CG17_big_fil_post_rev_8_21_14_2_50_63_15]|nr:biotin attachment protein [Roseovarius sp.]PIV78721.1 MAG: biotin attachment protein [Rhodobacteraceae bacterium CG17_big_fil_post_rev_8_21_14_2_50_63_15]